MSSTCVRVLVGGRICQRLSGNSKVVSFFGWECRQTNNLLRIASPRDYRAILNTETRRGERLVDFEK